MLPVKPSSTSAAKCCLRRCVTANAVKVGTSALPCRQTYPRRSIVEMIEAYVDGRPMPSSSRRLTSDASV